MAGGGSSREQNFWPGFVDALTNLVLVLVFVVVVFTFALFYFASQLAKQKISEAQAQCNQAALSRAPLTSELFAPHGSRVIGERHDGRADASVAGGASILSRSVEISRDASQASPDKDLPVQVSGKGGAVVVSFAPGVTDLSIKEKDAIDRALGRVNPSLYYELTAQPVELSPSEGRRLAYYRIATIRNHLVDGGVSPDHITMLIGDPGPAGNARSRVVVRTATGRMQ